MGKDEVKGLTAEDIHLKKLKERYPGALYFQINEGNGVSVYDFQTSDGPMSVNGKTKFSSILKRCLPLYTGERTILVSTSNVQLYKNLVYSNQWDRPKENQHDGPTNNIILLNSLPGIISGALRNKAILNFVLKYYMEGSTVSPKTELIYLDDIDWEKIESFIKSNPSGHSMVKVTDLSKGYGIVHLKNEEVKEYIEAIVDKGKSNEISSVLSHFPWCPPFILLQSSAPGKQVILRKPSASGNQVEETSRTPTARIWAQFDTGSGEMNCILGYWKLSLEGSIISETNMNEILPMSDDEFSENSLLIKEKLTSLFLKMTQTTWPQLSADMGWSSREDKAYEEKVLRRDFSPKDDQAITHDNETNVDVQDYFDDLKDQLPLRCTRTRKAFQSLANSISDPDKANTQSVKDGVNTTKQPKNVTAPEHRPLTQSNSLFRSKAVESKDQPEQQDPPEQHVFSWMSMCKIL